MKEREIKVAIVGAGGLVGSEFARRLSPQHDVLLLSHRDLDITDNEAVAALILKEQPTLIINCAVLGVDACEVDASLAWKVNAEGAENLATAAASVGAEVVQLSSNYVFDGRRSGDLCYTVADAPNPINIYGQTKLAGERAVKRSNQRSFIVRTSWVFGPGKENFFSAVPRLLRAGQQIQAITDMSANSTYVRDLVTRIMEIVSLRAYGTYHVVNRETCSYYEFAREAARIILEWHVHPARDFTGETPVPLGIPDLDCERLISKVSLSELELRAPRPKFTSMACRISAELGLAPMRTWRQALAEYIREPA